MKTLPASSLVLLAFASWGCLSRTAAEDPFPGPVLEAGVFASKDGTSRVVLVSVLVERDLAEARQWFLDAEHLERWLAEEVEVELEAGGALRVGWPSRGVAATGEVLEIDTGRSITFRLDPFAGAPETRLRISAEDAPGGVRVRLEQWPFPGDRTGDGIADRHRRAWFRALDVLRSELGRGLLTTPAPPPGS